MARLFYGGSGADVIARRVGGDDDTLELTLDVEYEVYTGRTGGSQVTDLLDADGDAITSVTPDEFGVRFQGPDGVTADLWLQNVGDEDEPRWLVKPAARDLAAEWEAYQAGATVVLKTNRAKNLRDVVTPSGVDDTAEVNAALADFAADGGGVLRIPRDNWKFTGATGLALTDVDVPIHIICDDGVEFDMTGLTAAQGLLLGGSVASSADLDADVDEGDEVITTALSVAPGDIIKLESTDFWSNDAIKGELCEVLSVSGDDVTLTSPLWDGYTAATTTVTKVKAPVVSVEGLTILRNTNDMGLAVEFARAVALAHCYGEGARERLFYVKQALGVYTENLRGKDFWYSGTGTSYGLAIASCQSVVEFGNEFRGGRHGTAHGGTFPCRDIQVIGGTYDSKQRGVASFDFHDNCEKVRMVGVTMLNGLGSGAADFEAVNCIARTPVSSTLAPLNLGAWRDCDYVKWIGGEVMAANPDTGAVIYTARHGHVKDVEISGHIIGGASTGKGVQAGPWSSAVAEPSIGRLTIGGWVEAGDNAVWLHAAGGAYDVPIEELRLHGRIKGVNDSAILVTNPEIERAYLDSAVVESAASAGRAWSGNGSGVGTDVFIRGSRLICSGGGAGANYFGTGRLHMDDVSLENFGSSGGVQAGSASEAFLSNVESINCTGSMVLPDRRFTQRHPDGTVETWGTAAPSAGTWSRGDKCWNTTPSAGGPPGWVCTTAGAPGTWKAMANVAA